MRVITLDNAQLSAACRRLEATVAAGGCRPDLVAGIVTGGERVAREMFANVQHTAVTCRRPSTAGKERMAWAMALVRRLPLRVRDALRMAEARRLASKGHSQTREVTVDDDARRMIAAAKAILVVDDAVDSGATLRTVTEAVRAINPSARVTTACLTVTTDRPVVNPDYTLYNNGTLIRFPWSMDMK